MEDDDIDDDIERLQIVLKNDELEDEESEEEDVVELEQLDAEEEESISYVSRPSTSSNITAESSLQAEQGIEESVYTALDPNHVSPETCLTMNKAYQEILMELLRQIELALTENRSLQRKADEELEEGMGKTSQKKSLVKPLSSYSMPYFKDAFGRCAPKNEDVLIKQQSHEPKQHIRPPPYWSSQARKVLTAAVRQDAMEQLLRPLMCRLELEHEKLAQCKNKEEIKTVESRITSIEEDMEQKKLTPPEQLLMGVDIERVDWMKISLAKFPSRYDHQACYQMWKNVLSPKVNRSKWSGAEEERLFALVHEHKMKNWKEIAEELGNNRTPFQCLQHFQEKSCVFDVSPWTAEEDELLKEVVETCKIGSDNIQWSQVAYYIEGRSGAQCTKRWQAINPQIRKGKWSEREDCLLMAAVQLLGCDDWMRIKDFVPGRASYQCRERWMHSLNPSIKPLGWQYEDDKLLMTKVQQHGLGNWKGISRDIPGRSENQLLLRYKRLMDWKSKMDKFYQEPKVVQKALMGALSKKANLNIEVTGNMNLAQLLEDYTKQEQDRKNGETVVPRPPPTHRYSVRNFHTTYARRENLRKLIEAQVDRTVKDMKGSMFPYCVAKEAADCLDSLTGLPIQDSKKKWEIVSSAMEGKQPHELTVREILNMSHSIAQDQLNCKSNSRGKTPYMGSKRKGPKQTRRPMTDFIEHRSLGTKLRAVVQAKMGTVRTRRCAKGRPRKICLWNKFSLMNFEPEEKPVRRKCLNLLLKTLDVNKVKMVKAARAVVSTKTSVVGESEDGKKKRVRVKSKNARVSVGDRETRLDRDCQALLELEADSRESESRRADTSQAASDSTPPAAGQQGGKTKGESESKENKISDDNLTSHLGRQSSNTETTLDDADKAGTQDLSKCDSAPSTAKAGERKLPEEQGTTSGEAGDQKAAGDKQGAGAGMETVKPGASHTTHTAADADSAYKLPFLPPNVSNLNAFKSLLLQRRFIADSAGRLYNPALYTKPKRTALKAEPSLESVMNRADIVGTQVKRNTMLASVTKGKDDRYANYKQTWTVDSLATVRQTEEYQKLKARFQSVFTWPALMSTIYPPKTEEAQQHGFQQSEAETGSQSASCDTREENQSQSVAADNPDGHSKAAVVDNLLTEIMDAYKEKREQRKSARRKIPMLHGPKKRRRNVTSRAWREKMTDKRERTKLLRKLGLDSLVSKKPESADSAQAGNTATGEEQNPASQNDTTQETSSEPVKRKRGRPPGPTRLKSTEIVPRRSGRSKNGPPLEVSHDTTASVKEEFFYPTVTPAKRRKYNVTPKNKPSTSVLDNPKILDKLRTVVPGCGRDRGHSPFPPRATPTSALLARRDLASRSSVFSSPGVDINTQPVVFEETVLTSRKGTNSRPGSQASATSDVFVPPSNAGEATGADTPTPHMMYYNALVPGVSDPVVIAIPAAALTPSSTLTEGGLAHTQPGPSTVTNGTAETAGTVPGQE